MTQNIKSKKLSKSWMLLASTKLLFTALEPSGVSMAYVIYSLHGDIHSGQCFKPMSRKRGLKGFFLFIRELV